MRKKYNGWGVAFLVGCSWAECLRRGCEVECFAGLCRGVHRAVVGFVSLLFSGQSRLAWEREGGMDNKV